MKRLVEESNLERVDAIINLLVKDFALSSQANHRKVRDSGRLALRRAGLVLSLVRTASLGAALTGALLLGMPCYALGAGSHCLSCAHSPPRPLTGWPDRPGSSHRGPGL